MSVKSFEPDIDSQYHQVDFSRARSYPMDEIEEWEDLEYLCKGFIDRACVSMLYGAPNCGKTYLALDLGLAVARGIDWHGHRTRQGKVIYLAAEARRSIKHRLKAYKQEHGIADAPFRVIPVDLDLYAGALDRGDLSDVDALIQEARTQGPTELLIIDTLAATMPGGDDSKTVDMSRYASHCRRIADQTGAHVMVLHHSGKDPTRGARGSMDFKGRADTEAKVEDDQGVRSVDITKQRDGPANTLFTFKLHQVVIGTDSDGDPVTSCIVHAAEPVANKVKLTGHKRCCYDALVKVLDDARIKDMGAELDLNSPQLFLKSGQNQVVRTDTWKAEFKARTITGADKGGQTFERTWRRVSVELQDLGVVGVRDNNAWIIQGRADNADNRRT